MQVAVKINRTVQEVQYVEVELDFDDLTDYSIRDAVEDKIAADQFEVQDADTHVLDPWEVEHVEES